MDGWMEGREGGREGERGRVHIHVQGMGNVINTTIILCLHFP